MEDSRLEPPGPHATERCAASNITSQSGDAINSLRITISSALQKKLTLKAQLEGVSISELAGELLAEGLVLRAWEIMERKSTMRGASPSTGTHSRNTNKQGFRNSGPNTFGRNRNHGGSSSPNSGNHEGQSNWGSRNSNYKNIMEDSANFLEYVRSQEKKQR